MKERAVVATIMLAACVPLSARTVPLPSMPFAIDTLRSERISEGVIHRYMYSSTGPWAIHVLDVTLTRCTAVQAVKGFPGAVGRERTSRLLNRLADTVRVLGGVNADFFRFTPPGVPIGTHVSRGRVVTEPNGGPVLAFDSAGTAHITALEATDMRVSLSPFHPLEAVGGRPVVVRDSSVSQETADTSSFSVTRHPRTGAGIANNGRRLILVVVDGRQPAYSVGMTLAELARFLLALGARDAINLDGGGSTTMVVASGDTVRVVNRPSDAQGERSVANALAIVRWC